jgi:hypothetical protein
MTVSADGPGTPTGPGLANRLPAAEHSVMHGQLRRRSAPDYRTERRIPRAMSDQDRRHSVTNADLRRGVRSPNPGRCEAGRPHGSARAAPPPRPCSQSGLMVSHWKGPAPCDHPRSRRHIDGWVNRDASPHTESPGSSLRRRPQLGAICWRGVLRMGTRAGPARTAARVVPAVLAEQDRPGPRGVRWLYSGRAAGTGLTGMPAGVSPLARSPAPDELITEILDQMLMPLIQPMRLSAGAAA